MAAWPWMAEVGAAGAPEGRPEEQKLPPFSGAAQLLPGSAAPHCPPLHLLAQEMSPRASPPEAPSPAFRPAQPSVPGLSLQRVRGLLPAAQAEPPLRGDEEAEPPLRGDEEADSPVAVPCGLGPQAPHRS